MSTATVRRATTSTGALLTAAALLAAAAPSALADTNPRSTADKAASTVEKATGTADIAPSAAAPGTPAAASTTTQAGTVTVAAPATANGQVSSTAPGIGTFALGLPATNNGTGIKAGGGTVVYPNDGQGTSLAVQPTTDGGARTLVTLENASASTTQRYTLNLPDGVEATADGQGGYQLVKGSGGSAVEVGKIDAPWAKDANGNQVPTSYKLDGNNLVQTITPNTKTAFPVVADPKVTWGIVSGTVYFNRHETQTIGSGGGAATSVLGTVAAIAGIITDPYLGIVVAKASLANAHGKCLAIKTTLYVEEYSGGYCS